MPTYVLPSPLAYSAVVVAATCFTLGSTVAAAQHTPQQHHAQRTTAVPAIAPQPLIFTGVTVVDVETGKLLPKHMVVVSGNRVQFIGPVGKAPIPAGARVVDAKGQYMIPGLWDMHTHVDASADEFYPRFIAHGITGLREMAQRFPSGADSLRAWQREIMAGTRVGPRIVGPSADYPAHFSSLDERDVLSTIDSLKTAGTAFLKYHEDGGDRSLFFAMAREARRVGIPMVGHVPTSVTNVEAADSGLRSIEHIDEQRQCWPNFPEPLGDSIAADKRCEPVAKAYIRNGTWIVPTFTTFWPEPSPHRQSAGVFKDALRLIRMMHRFGVKNFLAGTDWVLFIQRGWELQFMPGLSAAEELVFFGEAGFTPLQALQTGTLNPAQFFNATDSLGTVTVGKLADLVLLDANPLADIQNVLKVRSVVANGRYFDRATLDSLDPEGTKSGMGLVALEQRRQLAFSPNFVAGTDTTEVALTEDLLTRYVGVWKELRDFWQKHPALMDSAKMYADYPVIPGLSYKWRDPVKQVRMFDYVTLTAKTPALAEIFKKNALLPQQFWPMQVTLSKNALRSKLRRDLGKTPADALDTKAGAIARNIAFVEAHQADLTAVGITF